MCSSFGFADPYVYPSGLRSESGLLSCSAMHPYIFRIRLSFIFIFLQSQIDDFDILSDSGSLLWLEPYHIYSPDFDPCQF